MGRPEMSLGTRMIGMGRPGMGLGTSEDDLGWGWVGLRWVRVLVL